MKKAHVVPVHKKGDTQSLKNYRPISLLPTCSKAFEHLIYNEFFTFFTDNNLISPNQSGFRPGDSCVNQLIAVTHEIYKSFDDRLEVRGDFSDISKALDKVWHEGLLLKLSLDGIFFFFFYQGFLHSHWRFTGQQGKGGDHLFHSTTSTRSRILRHLFATLHVR